jgi:RNA polymerase primary sigma factor
MRDTRPHPLEASTDSLALYLESIRAYPLLTLEEERALGERIARGDEGAVERLVCANLRFVVSVARRYQHRGVGLPDLINEGNLGLVRSARRFDASRGIRFISYAVWWIRQGIVQAIAEQGRVVRLPVGRASALQRISRRANALAQELGREATRAEIAGALALSDEDIDQHLTLAAEPVSLDAPAGWEHEHVLADYLPDEHLGHPDREVAECGLADDVRRALGRLREREARILRLYFGLDGQRPKTLEEIGRQLGITRERVRQIKERTLLWLRTDAGSASLHRWSDLTDDRPCTARVAGASSAYLRSTDPTPSVERTHAVWFSP